LQRKGDELFVQRRPQIAEEQIAGQIKSNQIKSKEKQILTWTLKCLREKKLKRDNFRFFSYSQPSA
jgi:hypothetical protein